MERKGSRAVALTVHVTPRKSLISCDPESQFGQRRKEMYMPGCPVANMREIRTYVLLYQRF
ncbi:hypothetical protein FXV91_10090 [Methanosarcina sp. DH2]|uniref:hypothetical protein n=1 Tax=Methanosarcina sp. DH2 TaxID=2605639 RepID=UPI001E4AB9AF|nr:hypothetical protein [Methanosarcina sp. DH2]MCC4770525.1 hypothetical protein [Methanosarcina sp. DH2]